MEFNGRIVEFLENKSILVTGSTGFLGKVFVEKLLRVQPNVKHLFLPLRAVDPTSATQRLHSEVLEFVNFALLQYISGTCKDVERRINQMSRMIELNEPQVVASLFDDANTDKDEPSGSRYILFGSQIHRQG